MKSAFRFLVPLCFLVGVGCADNDAVISGSLSAESFAISQETSWETTSMPGDCEEETYAEAAECHMYEEVAGLHQ